MKNMKINILSFAGILAVGFGLLSTAMGQDSVTDVLGKSTLKDQMNYIQEKTRVYDNYRAIREDIFQLIKRNSLDSLEASRNEISGLKMLAATKSREIDSLNITIAANKKKLEEITTLKNSIRFLGKDINKRTYNGMMWSLVAILAIVIISGYLSYKRNRIVTLNAKKEFEDLKKEFDAYRKASREAREKMSMAHFNEIKKLRTG
jgi:hypothetical protein